MKRHNFAWSKKHYQHSEQAIESTNRLVTKAQGVLLKHALIPMATYDLTEWSRSDHYSEDLNAIESGEEGDKVWIKPWLIGQWLGGEECILQLEHDEFLEELYQTKEWAELDDWKHRHKRGVILGFYFTITNKTEGWSAVFALRVDDHDGGEQVQDIPISEMFCLSLTGDADKVEKWLDWAYKEST